MAEENNVIFREVQKFSLWLRLVVVFVVCLTVVIAYSRLREKILPSGEILPIIFVVFIAILFPTAIAVLFSIMKLETEVRDESLYVRFFPFHISFKKFTADDLSQFYARTYKPIREYGGWGIRCGLGKTGKAYNVSGNKGVQLVFKNDKRLLIGSQKPDELAEAIGSFMGKNLPTGEPRGKL
ncbi:MAG: DUF6141 family protein [Planctomycetota bacterium]|jgi:hypothetical protein